MGGLIEKHIHLTGPETLDSADPPRFCELPTSTTFIPYSRLLAILTSSIQGRRLEGSASQLLQVLGPRGDSGSNSKQYGQTVLSMASPLDEITGGVALAGIDRNDYWLYVDAANAYSIIPRWTRCGVCCGQCRSEPVYVMSVLLGAHKCMPFHAGGYYFGSVDQERYSTLAMRCACTSQFPENAGIRSCILRTRYMVMFLVRLF